MARGFFLLDVTMPPLHMNRISYMAGIFPAGDLALSLRGCGSST
jgi:hypothetical protein